MVRLRHSILVVRSQFWLGVVGCGENFKTAVVDNPARRAPVTKRFAGKRKPQVRISGVNHDVQEACLVQVLARDTDLNHNLKTCHIGRVSNRERVGTYSAVLVSPSDLKSLM